MNIEEYIKEMKGIQENLLDFLESGTKEEYYFQRLYRTLNDLHIQENLYNFRSFLYLISRIADNYCRKYNLIGIVERILHLFGDFIRKYFKNSEIFTIFKKNKRILLFLIEEKIFTIDKYIADDLLHYYKYTEMSYQTYFAPEMRPYIKLDEYTDESDIEFIKQHFFQEFTNDFFEKRKIGENDNYICQLIRKDMIEEFIVYVNRNNISLESLIKPSIFETNSFLLKNKEVSLIEYAAFFGSIQIFQYLKINNVKLNSSLIIYEIHSKNAELIHLIEESNAFSKTEENYKNCLYESIKCHHNNISNYFISFLSLNIDEIINMIQTQILKFYNFAFIQKNDINQSTFHLLCQYDYYTLVNELIKIPSIKINELSIYC